MPTRASASSAEQRLSCSYFPVRDKRNHYCLARRLYSSYCLASGLQPQSLALLPASSDRPLSQWLKKRLGFNVLALQMPAREELPRPQILAGRRPPVTGHVYTVIDCKQMGGSTKQDQKVEESRMKMGAVLSPEQAGTLARCEGTQKRHNAGVSGRGSGRRRPQRETGRRRQSQSFLQTRQASFRHSQRDWVRGEKLVCRIQILLCILHTAVRQFQGREQGCPFPSRLDKSCQPSAGTGSGQHSKKPRSPPGVPCPLGLRRSTDRA